MARTTNTSHGKINIRQTRQKLVRTLNEFERGVREYSQVLSEKNYSGDNMQEEVVVANMRARLKKGESLVVIRPGSMEMRELVGNLDHLRTPEALADRKKQILSRASQIFEENRETVDMLSEHLGKTRKRFGIGAHVVGWALIVAGFIAAMEDTVFAAGIKMFFGMLINRDAERFGNMVYGGWEDKWARLLEIKNVAAENLPQYI